jgi:site-specific DNA-methyltransferase (adenine-specific)
MIYYQDQHITLYHGDCREIAPTLGRFDLLLTDPPYGIADCWKGGFSSKHGWGKAGKDADERNEWDGETPDKVTIDMLRGSAEISLFWGGNYFELPVSRGWLIWNKPERNFTLSEAELCWTSIDMPMRVYDCRRSDPGRVHPTQKPLELMKWCIGFAPKAKTIFDPYAGSGTIGRASKDMGLHCTMIEQKERHCETIAKRMAQEVLF